MSLASFHFLGKFLFFSEIKNHKKITIPRNKLTTDLISSISLGLNLKKRLFKLNVDLICMRACVLIRDMTDIFSQKLFSITRIKELLFINN